MLRPAWGVSAEDFADICMARQEVGQRVEDLARALAAARAEGPTQKTGECVSGDTPAEGQ